MVIDFGETKIFERHVTKLRYRFLDAGSAVPNALQQYLQIFGVHSLPSWGSAGHLLKW
jgi:hypothetical protein